MRSPLPSTRRQALTALAALLLPIASQAATPPTPLPFPLTATRLLPGNPFYAAQEVDRAYLHRLEPDRLLAHMRQNAGLKPLAPHYGGWDSGGAGTVGHYLSACSHMVAATGDTELKRRIAYIVAQMAECQHATGDGGLYGFDYDRNVYFARMKTGDLKDNRVTGWYLMHKNMAGLRDACVEGGCRPALDVLTRLGDWVIEVTARLTPAQWQTMLGGEHGAPHEIMADLYALTGQRKYLDNAVKWRHTLVFDPLLRADDAVLNGLHANENVPKFVGYQRIAELTGDPTWHTAARNFWNAVVDRHTWANSGDGQWEHFFDPAQTATKLDEVCGPETCATYNMVKLARQLFLADPAPRYIDYYERALYNGILPSQSPESGFVYYTSMRPGNYRVFSRPFDAFWCCVGTGMENHGKYGELIYARQGTDRLLVNFFIASTLTWHEAGLTLRQDTDFPARSETHLTVTAAHPTRLTLSVRYPTWAAHGALTVRINGKPFPIPNATPGSYIDITRTWKTGARIDITLPMALSTEPAPNAPNYAAFFYGPILLAGVLGTDGLTHADFYGGGDNTDINNQLARKELPDDAVPLLVTSPSQALTQFQPVSGKPLAFRLTGIVKPHDVTLVPLYDLPLQRYAVYWPITTQEAYANASEARRQEAACLIDHVLVGDDASEAAHHLTADHSHTGGASGRFTHWRDATSSFGYTLKVDPNTPTQLQCAYWGSDTNRTFDILIDGHPIATQHLTAEKPNDYLIVTYPIPAELTHGHSTVTVRFQAAPASTAGGLFDLKTLRAP